MLTPVSEGHREDQAAAKTRGMDARLTETVAAVTAMAGPTCAFSVSVGLWGPHESPQEPPGLQEGRDLLCLIFRRSCPGHPPHQTAAEGQCGDLSPPQAFSGGAGKPRCAVRKGAECTAFLGAPQRPSEPVSPSRPPSTWPTGSAGGSASGRPAAGAGQRVEAALQHSLLLY